MFLESKHHNRWERQKEVLLLLNDNWFSVRDLSDYLDITINHSDFLLRYYMSSGFLKRSKIDRKFHYILTESGLKQLKWLETNEYQKYTQLFENYKEMKDNGEIEADLSFKDFKEMMMD